MKPHNLHRDLQLWMKFLKHEFCVAVALVVYQCLKMSALALGLHLDNKNVNEVWLPHIYGIFLPSSAQQLLILCHLNFNKQIISLHS